MGATLLYGNIGGAKTTPPLLEHSGSESHPLIPRRIGIPPDTESLTKPLRTFCAAYAHMSKAAQIIQYLKGSTGSCPNSLKLSASTMWNFLTSGGNYDRNFTYDANRDTWYVRHTLDGAK